MSGSLSDEALLAGLAAGQTDAAAAFVRRHQARVHGLVLTIVRDPGTADDVAQEAFVRAWRHAGSYDPRRGRVVTWRARRLLTWLAPPIAAAAITAAALVGVYHDDRVTAQRYRTTLEQANGQYFQAERLRDATGARAGVAFGYQGSPSWMLVTVDPGHRNQVASAELVTRDRRTIPLPDFELGPDGSRGAAIPIDLRDVAALRLLGNRPGQVLEASTYPK